MSTVTSFGMNSSDEESPTKRVKTGENEESSTVTAPSSNDTTTTTDPTTITTTTTTSTTTTSTGSYPRRLVSVFSSNQAIHKLTDKIVRSQQQQEQQEKEQQQAQEKEQQAQQQAQEKEQQEKEQPLHSNLRKDSDEIEVTESNAINPNIDYPHLRHFCGLYKFESNSGSGTNSVSNESLLFCPKCYCSVCNIPAQQCKTWSHHCFADDSLEWKEQRRLHAATSASIVSIADATANGTPRTTTVVSNADGTTTTTDHVILLDDSSDDDPHPQDSEQDINMEDDQDSYQDEQDNEHLLHQMKAQAMNNYSHHFDPSGPGGTDKDMIGQKPRKDARISEVLAHNIRQISNLAIANSSTSASNRSALTAENNHKMEGDVPQLNLHNSFFVEGVRIGWPYPAIMPPQRLMAIHLTKAFKNKRHVVIESPTGTGKSAAILCAALAWQRYDAKTNEFGETTKIIYCSRTHSQVAQMVSSLKKTPYRPRMAILGSRDRLCIHKELRPRKDAVGNASNGNNKPKGNLNTGCQMRVGNTESYRKYAIRSQYAEYDDDAPPTFHPGDDNNDSGFVQNDNDGNDDGDGEETGTGTNRRLESDKTKMCPHYRQLTSEALAKKAMSTFVPDKVKVNCCSMGGEKTKFGTHDIEDLVEFGANPNVIRGVALYREPDVPSFGLQLGQQKGSKGSITVSNVPPGGSAIKEGTIQQGDTIVTIDSLDVSRGRELKDVSNRIRETKDPLLLDVYRGVGDDIDENEYSEDSACPYYLSRALAKGADLVFCPYNYVLDPSIRSAMEIKVENAIIVLDEAHNVEDTLRQEGSGKYGEIELLEMNFLLSSYASKWEPSNQRLDSSRREESMHDKMPEAAHDILVFLEKIFGALKESRDAFENDQGKNGETSASEEYGKFKCPDDKEWEMKYYGPSGSGDGRNPVGCKGFFQSLNVTPQEIEKVQTQMGLCHETLSSKRGADDKSQNRNTAADRLFELVTTLCSAFKLSEHYYISTAITANGNLDFATGSGDGNNRMGRFKRNPKPCPQNPPLTANNPRPRNRICNHPTCNKQSKGTISHDAHCNGETPRWESHLIINLLTPGILMAPLLRDCRSVVLASGSLAPIGSLCSELHLLPPAVGSTDTGPTPKSKEDSKEDKGHDDPLSIKFGRLQVTPRPLEANHVVSLPKQLLALSIGHFPDGSPLSCTYSSYSKAGFHDKLGLAIASIIESIPKGGVLVFFPSFSFLRKCVSTWQNSSTWQRLLSSKGEVVVEPSSSQSEFEEARGLFNGTIERTGNCILLAVFRGKMSEGVSFNDDYARGVICVGVPFPSSYDRSISAKMAYNNEQRRFRKKDLLPGSEWYSQQAYRAIAQAIGRCIRHAADYGTIILLDSRHCDDGHSYNQSGICRAHTNLPKWMRSSVRTLRRDMRREGRNDLLGGWNNLQKEMRSFFQAASVHGASVLKKQKEEFKRKQESTSLSQDLAFDHKSGKWSSSQTTPKKE